MDFSKEFFKQAWGKDGYYENFSYGVGIDKVCEVCLYPFVNGKDVLEIGAGGGVFTERIIGKPNWFGVIDVIPKPDKFSFTGVQYIELPNQDYYCTGVPDNSMEFVFAYNVFCHLSNEALIQYVQSVRRVIRTGGNFVFMLSSYGRSSSQELGTLLPVGHFAQDDRTIDIIVGEGWQIVSRNMIPEHRDIIVHLKAV